EPRPSPSRRQPHGRPHPRGIGAIFRLWWTLLRRGIPRDSGETNMMRGAVPNILESVGHTPIVKLQKVARHVAASIYMKCEYLNPAGSMKDRVAMNIVADAERRGLLRAGGTIIEATSGNTGMGLAMVAAVRGYSCIFVMPDKMSQEKIASLRAFG